MLRRFLAVVVASLGLAASPALADGSFLIRGVTDGDTIAVTAPWAPASLQRMSIRVRGIDTPEKGFRAKCPEEDQLGHEATDFFTHLVTTARSIQFLDLGWDKYGGRVLASVVIDGRDAADIMIAAGLARPYFGEAKSSWCGLP